MLEVCAMLLMLLAASWSGVNSAKEDLHDNCLQWASAGECDANPSYMLASCALSCDLDYSFQDADAAVDKHDKCTAWAEGGECEANPNYMLRNCRKSCRASAERGAAAPVPVDFYSISERDIHGNVVLYDQFRGKNVYIVNVASQCGYTAENYRLLRLLSLLRSEHFEVLIFPCNQFGGQEPGNEHEILHFAQQAGFEGRVMAKGDVNGKHAGPTFAFLKSQTGKKHISWNFDGKFLVTSAGAVRALGPADHDVLGAVQKQLREDSALLGAEEL